MRRTVHAERTLRQICTRLQRVAWVHHWTHCTVSENALPLVPMSSNQLADRQAGRPPKLPKRGVRDRIQRRRLLHKLIAAEVRAAMARHRVTGELLAEKLGVSRTFVSRRLRDITAFDLDDLEAIAEIFDMTVEDLLLPAIRQLDEYYVTSRSVLASSFDVESDAATGTPINLR